MNSNIEQMSANKFVNDEIQRIKSLPYEQALNKIIYWRQLYYDTYIHPHDEPFTGTEEEYNDTKMMYDRIYYWCLQYESHILSELEKPEGYMFDKIYNMFNVSKNITLGKR